MEGAARCSADTLATAGREPSIFKNQHSLTGAREVRLARTGVPSSCPIFRSRFRRIVLSPQYPPRGRKMAGVDHVGCRSMLMPLMALTPSASRRFGQWLIA